MILSLEFLFLIDFSKQLEAFENFDMLESILTENSIIFRIF